MNSRYQILATQASDWCVENADSFDTNAWQWERKFAELILRDVLIICENVATPFEDDSTNVSGAEICLEMINENFGIKE